MITLKQIQKSDSSLIASEDKKKSKKMLSAIVSSNAGVDDQANSESGSVLQI